jgi:hypothetical protein
MAENTFTLNVDLQSAAAVSGLKDIQKELKNVSDAAKDISKGFGQSVKGMQSSISGLTGNLKNLTSGGIGGAVDAIADLTGGMGIAAGAIAGVGLAAVAASAALVANAITMALAADDAAELADKLGLTTTELAALDLAAKENGTTVTGLVSTYDKLTNSLDEAASGNLKMENAFRKLGISQEDLAGKSKEQIAGMVIKNYEALGRSITATAAAQDLLGKSFREQVPAIKAVADGLQDYTDRASKAVASKELEEAGSRLEKSFNNLGLAVKEARNDLARGLAEMLADIIDWVAKAQPELAKLFEGNVFSTASAGADLIRLKKQFALTADQLKQAKDEAEKTVEDQMGTGVQGLLNRTKFIENMNKVTIEYAKNVRKLTQDLKAQSDQEAKRLAGRTATPPTPLPEKKELKQEKLTDEQRAIIALSNAYEGAVSDINRQIEIFVADNDAAEVSVINLAHKLFDAAKGFIDYDLAIEMARKHTKDFQDQLENTNTLKFEQSVKSLNQDLELQLKILTATTEKDKEQIRLREQLNKLFENQKGGATPEQAKALEEALKRAGDQFDRLSKQKIGNSVRDSMRDLTEQSRDLAFEIDHFWDVNRDGLVNTNQQLQALFKQIDPEGRGKNITEQQKSQLESQLKVIEGQKRLIEQNQMIEKSFQDLGSAVSDWALGSENGIKRVKIELLKLIALSALRAAGTTGTGVGDLFVQGLVSGLSGGRASGGPMMAGGAYRVGESGPETIVAGRNSYVIPADQMRVSSTTGQPIINVSPQLTVYGSIVNQDDLDRQFGQLALHTAQETKNLVDSRFAYFNRR